MTGYFSNLKKLVLLTLALGLIATPCHARLGETLEQCIARFGQPTTALDLADSSGGRQGDAAFSKNGYIIAVSLLGGFVEAETFFKVDKSAFTNTERDTLLAADSDSQRWVKSTEPSINDVWIREDGALAIDDRLGHSLVICTKKYVLRTRARTESDQKSKLKDF